MVEYKKIYKQSGILGDDVYGDLGNDGWIFGGAYPGVMSASNVEWTEGLNFIFYRTVNALAKKPDKIG